MKKFFRMTALVTAIAMASLMLVPAFAEEEKKDENILTSAADFLSDTWKSISDWVTTAWDDSSKWLTQAWTDSADWLNAIWGDASGWVVDNYNTASEAVIQWWNSTFNKVTEGEWDWIEKDAKTLRSQYSDRVDQFRNVIDQTGEEAEASVKDLFFSMVRYLGLNDEDTEKVWESVAAYAEKNQVSTLNAAKLALPYLLPLAVEESDIVDNASGLSVSLYLTAILEKQDIKSDAAAENLIGQLKAALKNV